MHHLDRRRLRARPRTHHQPLLKRKKRPPRLTWDCSFVRNSASSEHQRHRSDHEERKTQKPRPQPPTSICCGCCLGSCGGCECGAVYSAYSPYSAMLTRRCCTRCRPPPPLAPVTSVATTAARPEAVIGGRRSILPAASAAMSVPSFLPPSLPPDPDLMGRAAVTQALDAAEGRGRDSHSSQFSAHHAPTHCWVKDCFLPSASALPSVRHRRDPLGPLTADQSTTLKPKRFNVPFNSPREVTSSLLRTFRGRYLESRSCSVVVGGGDGGLGSAEGREKEMRERERKGGRESGVRRNTKMS